MDTRRTIEEMPLEGGHLALDFANTTGGLRDQPPAPDDEMLLSCDDLVTWAERIGLLASEDRVRLAAGDAATLERALALRAAIYAAFRPLAEGREPDARALEELREAERDALAGARLAHAGDVLRWAWPPPAGPADLLGPVAHAAIELLTGGPLDRVKVCANCRWLFLDHSRNRSRRWCSMDQCGTQIKQRRFVERRRERRTRPV